MKFGREAKVGIGVAAAYRASGQTRAEFCREQGLPVTTLDYYLRRELHHSQQKLIPVRVIPEAAPTKPGSGFTLVLSNGLRLEMAADFDAPALARLIAAIQTSTEISSGRG